MFLRKGVLKIWSKFTGERPCRSVISIKLLCKFFLNFINAGGEFEISYHNIYHKELELRKVKSVKSLAIVMKIIETDTGRVL